MTTTLAIMAFTACIAFPAKSMTAWGQTNEAAARDPQIKMFHLEHASAHEMADVIASIFRGDLVALATDKRTNSLILRTNPDTAEAIEAVLLRLDQPGSGSSRQAAGKPAPVAKTAPAGGDSADTESISLHSTVSSAIVSIVPDGTPVKKGQLIVELDADELDSAIRVQQIEAEALKAGPLRIKAAERQKLRNTELLDRELHVAELRKKQAEFAMRFELTEVEGRLAVARQRLKAAEAHEKRLIKLQQSGQNVASEMNDVMLAMTEAKAEYEVAKARHELLKSATHPLETATADLEIARIRQSLGQSEVEQQGATAEMAALKFELERKLVELDQLKDLKAKCKIVAPIDGTVHHHTRLKPGSLVRERQTLVHIEPPR